MGTQPLHQLSSILYICSQTFEYDKTDIKNFIC